MTYGVDRLCISRQDHRSGIHQVFPDHDLLRRFRAEGAHTLANSDLAHRHHLREIDLDRAIELLRLEEAISCVADGIAVLEFELAETSLHRLTVDPAMRLDGRLRLNLCHGDTSLTRERLV